MKYLLVLSALIFSLSFAQVEPSPAPEGAEVYFINLADGAEVSSPVRILFGLRNAGVAPAGVEREGTGHHHLLINNPAYDATLPLPAGDFLRHFGGGQTETELVLEPGTYTLQLLFANYMHIPFEPSVASETITITVVE